MFSVSCVCPVLAGIPAIPLFPLPFSLFPSSRFCPRCPVRATSASASPSFDISYFVISAFSVVLCARVLRAHLSPRLSLRLSLRPFLRHCMPACLYVHSAGFLLLFRRMSSGIFCVHCAACYAACFVSIVRDIIPLRPIPPTPVGLTLGATPPSSFLPFLFFLFLSYLPFPSFDISICRISLSRNLRCPARVHDVLCSRVPRAILPRFVLNALTSVSAFFFLSLLLFSFTLFLLYFTLFLLYFTCSFYTLPVPFFVYLVPFTLSLFLF